MPELRDALREATNKLGVLAGNPQLIAFDAMLTSYPTLTVAGAIGFGVNPANAFAGAAATIEVIANGANVPTFAGITATGSYVNTAGAVNRIEFECLPSGPGSALAFYAKIGNGGGAAPVTSVAGRTGAVILDKGDVGLGAVDNTADADKPVSSAVASAIGGRQPIDGDLTSIAGLTTTGFVRRTGSGTADTVTPSPSGLTVLTDTPAAARGAIGVKGLSTQDFIGQDLSVSGYLANSQWGNRKSCVSRAIQDRMAGAHLKYAMSTAGAATSPETPFGGALGNFCEIPAGQSFTWTFDLSPVRFALTYPIGAFIATVYGSNPPDSYVVETQDYFTSAWETRITNNSPTVGANFSEFPNTFFNFKGFRITVTSGAAVTRIAAFEYFPFIPNDEESGTFLMTALGASPQKAFSPLQVRNATGSSQTTIGPGTLQFNGGAIVSAAKSAVSPTPSGSITVTGALVGEWYAVAATNGSAAAMGVCSSAGTVTYNATGFTGAVKASHLTIG